MRYAVIMAGGSGTRLWPMSVKKQPKQLIPFLDGESLLETAYRRLEGLIPPDNRYICAGEPHRQAVMERIPGLAPERFLGEPQGRDTLNALGFSAQVLLKRDPQAVMAVFTADHLIRPEEEFRAIVDQAFRVAEAHPEKLVTFGVTPDEAATGFGYLELGEALQGGDARCVKEFREKPDRETAETYLKAGPERYLWNSGMFVWQARTFWNYLERFEPANAALLEEIGEAWGKAGFSEVLAANYGQLKKISVDFAVMEKAAADKKGGVLSVPMPLEWLDIGSWSAYASVCETDESGNASGADRFVGMDSKNNVVASSDGEHLIALLGCDEMVVVHTPRATLVCPRRRVQEIKALYSRIGDAGLDGYL